MNEKWTTEIEYTVTPTDDPDVVVVSSGAGKIFLRRGVTIRDGKPYAYTEAARRYFDAHPPKPAHPLADAKEGEWRRIIWVGKGDIPGRTTVECITSDSFNWRGVESSDPVYVIPKDEADANVAHFNKYGFAQGHAAEVMLGLAL